jgi:hypothetical protein
MKLPPEVREKFRRYGRLGGKARAVKLHRTARRRAASLGATARWIKGRFGDTSFAALGLPGGDIIDTGLADLASGTISPQSLAVSLAAPRLRREGVPIPAPFADAEDRLYDLLSEMSEDLAHARYGAYLRQLASFASACRFARRDRVPDAS